MKDTIDQNSHIGEKHGIYTIIDVLDKRDKYGNVVYKSVCSECGHIKFSSYSGVSAPTKIATKCNHRRSNGQQILFRYTWHNKRIGRIFAGMLSRCYDDNDKSYKYYGENGIGICQEWIDNPGLFEEWSLNNGYSDNLTIDRIESSKDYCPDNCQWITLEENSRKAGNANWITINNITLTGKQWAKKLGIGINTINKAIKQHGIEKTQELIIAMLKDPPTTKYRKSHQTWFSVYGIQV